MRSLLIEITGEVPTMAVLPEMATDVRRSLCRAPDQAPSARRSVAKDLRSL